MLSNEKEINELYLSLEKVIFKVKNDLLTKQELIEEDLNLLYEKLKVLCELLDQATYLPRKLVNLLFSFYVTAETEISFRKPERGVELYFIPYLQTYLDEIFCAGR